MKGRCRAIWRTGVPILRQMYEQVGMAEILKKDDSGAVAGVSRGVCVERRGRTFHRGNGRDFGFKYSSGQVAVAARSAATAGAAEPVLPRKSQKRRWEVTCTEFLAQLDDLIDDEVNRTLRADLEEHLRECEHCEITLNTTRTTIQIYRKHEIYELPDDVRERLEKAIMSKCRNC